MDRLISIFDIRAKIEVLAENLRIADLYEADDLCEVISTSVDVESVDDAIARYEEIKSGSIDYRVLAAAELGKNDPDEVANIMRPIVMTGADWHGLMTTGNIVLGPNRAIIVIDDDEIYSAVPALWIESIDDDGLYEFVINVSIDHQCRCFGGDQAYFAGWSLRRVDGPKRVRVHKVDRPERVRAPRRDQ